MSVLALFCCCELFWVAERCEKRSASVFGEKQDTSGFFFFATVSSGKDRFFLFRGRA
jgi:hypothetical protein